MYECIIYIRECSYGVATSIRLPKWSGLFYKKAVFTKALLQNSLGNLGSLQVVAIPSAEFMLPYIYTYMYIYIYIYINMHIYICIYI